MIADGDFMNVSGDECNAFRQSGAPEHSATARG